jgi:hypothetical protein
MRGLTIQPTGARTTAHVPLPLLLLDADPVDVLSVIVESDATAIISEY